MYALRFAKSAEKQLYKLPALEQERIIRALERLRIRPHAHVKRLVGERAYSFRVGQHRLILDIEMDAMLILVIKVGHRRNVYK